MNNPHFLSVRLARSVARSCFGFAALAIAGCMASNDEPAADVASPDTAQPANDDAIDSDDVGTADEPLLTTPTAGRRRTIGPSDDFAAALSALGPGDTLFLLPGTYESKHAFTVTPGTEHAQVQITAADRAHPPLIQGTMYFKRANYWHLSFMRIQGTFGGNPADGDRATGKPTLWIFGGHDWSIRHCEIFGAKETFALGNIAINDDDDVAPSPDQHPNHFNIEFNCIHDAGLGEPGRISQFHNIYLGSHGPGPGLIARNVFFNAPAGEHVKIGEGDLSTPDTISNVSVLSNTMWNSRVAGVLSGGPGVHGEILKGNLIDRVTRADGPRPGIYLTRVDGQDAIVAAHNYGSGMGPQVVDIFDSTGSYVPGRPDLGDNRVGPDPRFDATTCHGFHPRNADAARYGRYGTF